MKDKKILLEFLGWKYIPFNDLQGFPQPGWYIIKGKTNFLNETIARKRVGTWFMVGTNAVQYKARNTSDVHLSTDFLLNVVNSIELLDTRPYGYKWADGDEMRFNNCGFEMSIMNRTIYMDLMLDLDPDYTVSKREFKYYGEPFRQALEEVVIETVKVFNSWVDGNR